VHGGAYPSGDFVRQRALRLGITSHSGLQHDGETFPAGTGVDTDRHGVARPDPRHRGRGPLDVGRIHVAATEDDDVLLPAADDDLTVHEVSDVAGGEPALGVLRVDRPVDRQVAGRDRVPAQVYLAHL